MLVVEVSEEVAGETSFGEIGSTPLGGQDAVLLQRSADVFSHQLRHYKQSP